MKKQSIFKFLSRSDFSLILSGFFIVPLFSLWITVQHDLVGSNFTSLATDSSTLPFFIIWFIITLLTLCFLLLHYFKSFPLSYPLPFYPFPLFAILSSLLPYSNGLSFFGLLHVLFAYLTFFYLHLLLFLSLPSFFERKSTLLNSILFLYLLALAICFVFSIYGGSINFLVEIIYLISFSILLTIIFVITKKK